MRILIVEDDPAIADLLTDFLADAGYEILRVSDGLAALETFRWRQDSIDLVLLDILLPGLDGFSVCRRIRESSNVPIIMLTALGDERDQMTGFDLLVDDYIAKPFSAAVLLRRIKAVLRRASGPEAKRLVQCGPLTLDPNSYQAKADGRPLELTTREFEILLDLCTHPGRVMTRQNLLDDLWDHGFYGDPRTVDTHVKNLRRKLGEASRLIQTVRGIGYRLNTDAT